MTEPYLNSPQALATFFAGMGYDRADIIAGIREDFPSDDVEAIVDEAIAKVAERDEEIDREVEKDEQAARAAEHDTSRTMHRKEQ